MFRYLIVLLLTTFTLSASWHQQYKEIKEPVAKQYALEAFRYAEQLYGKADFKINEFYLYRSVKNDKPYLFSSADVVNWERLRKVLSIKGRLLGLSPYENREKWIDSINQLILGDPITSKIENWELNELEAKLAGEGFWGWFTKDIKLLNRRILERFFDGELRAYVKRRGAKKGVQLCELLDAKEGVCVLYLTRNPNEEGFYDELGHEVFHLLNPKYTDWFMEGWASVFSEDFAKRKGKSWEVWKKLLMISQRPCTRSHILCLKKLN